MSHLERVSDEPRESGSSFAFIAILALVVIVFVGGLVVWSMGYFSGPQTVNMMQPPAVSAPAQQGMPGAAGAPGAGGAGGAAGAPGAAGAAGAAGATSTP